LFPISSDHIDSVSLRLRGQGEITLGLRSAETVYDFQSTTDLTRKTIKVTGEGWQTIPLKVKVKPNQLYWIYLEKAEGVEWARHQDPRDVPAQSPVGCTAAELPGPTRWHALTNNQNFALKIEPQQHPYEATNVARGTNRPDRWPNIWISESLPATLELRWPTPQRIGTVQLTFDTDMNRHTRQPLFRYPDCVRAYTIEAEVAGRWQQVAEEKDNYMRRRVLRFPPVQATALRLKIEETNGAKTARLYELRAYA
jgi:hypothetical protein